MSDAEWAIRAPYLRLMKEETPHRQYSMRAMFNAVRYMVRAGCPWRMIPNDLPPWFAVHQQAQRWIQASCFEAMAQDLRKMLRLSVHNIAAQSGDSRQQDLAIHTGKRAARRL